MSQKRSVALSPGIPTVYKGVQLRSRTEARWAAFFDALGWSWEYEPIDLEAYIPDFVLRFEYGPLLIEVKPEMLSVDLAPACAKIDASSWQQEALVTLAAPIWVPSAGYGPVLGRLRDAGARAWNTGEMFYCLSCGHLSLLCSEMSWRCRQCGACDGNGHVGEADGVIELWKEACNRVQWFA